MAAFDDLALSTMPNPNDPAQNLVFVKNRNTGKSIRGTFRLSANASFEVYDLTGQQARPFMPLEFEIRVPSGGRAFVAFDSFSHYLEWPHNHIQELKIQAEIVGGVYISDEPLPVPAPDIGLNYISRYYARTDDPEGAVEYFINMNPVWGIRFRVIHVQPPHDGGATALDPFTQRALAVGREREAYSLRDVSFYRFQMLPLFLDA